MKTLKHLEESKTKQILSQVKKIEIQTKRIVSDAMAGAYHSAFKGNGLDFDGIREYLPGDDVRRIDWNATAKSEKAFIKTFKEDRELSIILLIDLSASNHFGSGSVSKREMAAEIASVLAFSATRNNDKVGLILFTDHIETYIPARKGRQHILRLIREALFYTPKHKKTNTESILAQFNKIHKKTAIVFLISDFLQNINGKLPNIQAPRDDALFKALKLTNKKHDLICIQTQDPRELELPRAGIIVLEDSETGEQVEIDSFNKKTREAYRHLNEKRQLDFEAALNKTQADFIKVSTDASFIDPIQSFFRKRMAKKK